MKTWSCDTLGTSMEHWRVIQCYRSQKPPTNNWFWWSWYFWKEEERLTKLVFSSFVQTAKKGSSDVIKSKEEALFSESELAGQPQSIVRMKIPQIPQEQNIMFRGKILFKSICFKLQSACLQNTSLPTNVRCPGPSRLGARNMTWHQDLSAID